MDIYALSGVLGTVLSFATFLIPEKWKSKRITLVIFVFVVVVLASIIVNQNSKLSRIKKISLAAEALTSNKETKFSYDGYIQAGLAFLEQNKDVYPDTYKRATAIYEKYKAQNFNSSDAVYLSSEMDGLITGIALLNSIK